MIRPWTRRHTLTSLGTGAGILALAAIFGKPAMKTDRPALKPVAYSAIEGWEGEDHAEAFAVLLGSCRRIADVAAARARAGSADRPPHVLAGTCAAALGQPAPISRTGARAFFEDHLTPHRYEGDGLRGFVTGYYEPVLAGSRTRSEKFSVPVYGAPDDLVQLFPDEERARRNTEMTSGRREGSVIVPYHDRAAIEQGALAGRNLEILWLADPVDAFYMHIQGSGRVALAEGGEARLSYAAKNGHPYTAIGGVLIERGEIAREDMSMAAVRGWLADHPDEARGLMRLNRSYIFFRELPPDPDAPGPQGAQGVPLTPRRSLAVDTSIHAAGTPVWVDAPSLEVHGEAGFHRLMIAQDTGSAIRGPERGDIFWGSGEAAGALAGSTRHAARFTIFLPRGVKPAS